MGIAVFGCVFVDIKGYPLAPYIPQGRNIGRVLQVHGGVCRNVAEDIANIDLKPSFITVVDHSGTSTDVIAHLKRHNCDTRYIRRAADAIGTWLAVFDNNGDVAASISKRPDISLISRTLDEHGETIFREADSVIVEIDMEEYLLERIFALAEQYGKKIYAVVSNMSIAMERRRLLQRTGCIVCNQQEAEQLFSEEYGEVRPSELADILSRKIRQARIPAMVITLGERGAVYASDSGEAGWCAAQKVDVIDTTGAGDSFFAGVAVGLTYGKTLKESCEIGTRLAVSVICTKENVCPHFLPEEFGLRAR